MEDNEVKVSSVTKEQDRDWMPEAGEVKIRKNLQADFMFL
jgi:hypothetical protein